jgi:hypothetical protein
MSNSVDRLLRDSAVTGATPTDRDVRAALDGGTAVQRALAARAIHAASRRIRDRLLVLDPDDPSVELADVISTTAAALAAVADY